MNVASEYGAMMITTKVRQLLHEMSVLFASMPADANSMREQIRKNVVELEQILEITRKYELGDLVKQWHQLAEKEARFKGLLPYDKKLKIKRDYIRLIFPEGIGPLDPDILDTIAQSGIEPEKLGDLHKLRVIPVKDKSNLLEFFADLISALRTIRRIEDTDEFVRNVFRGVLGEVMIKEVHLASFLERLVGLISAGSPACKIRIDIPANLVAVVDRPTLGIVAKNFICNAIEAIGSFQTERDEIYVTAKIEKDDLIIDVVSPPPLIPPEVVSKMFYPEFTTKPGWGRGLGLATARDIAQQAGATIEYHAKNGKNVFTLIFPQSKMGPVVGRNKK
jgi:signal transduction histidine kinase